MKRILYVIPFLIFAVYQFNKSSEWQAYADTVTSGSVGLLQVSTGVVDIKRHYISKYNENFKIIASTLNTALTNADTYNNFRATADSQMTTFQNYRSTGDSKGLQTSIDTGTLRSQFYVYASTTDNRMNNLAVPLTIRNAGVLQGAGNITTLDFTTNQTATVSGTTATISATGGGAAVSNTTNTWCLHSGGDAFLSTTTWVPIPSAFHTVRGSTWTTARWYAYTAYPSTSTYTWLGLVKSTSTDVGSPWVNVSGTIEISTNAKYSVVYPSAVVFNDRESFALHIDSVTVGSQGLVASECELCIEYWKQAVYP